MENIVFGIARSRGFHLVLLLLISTMENIKELIQPHKQFHKTLRCAGKLGEELGLECYVVGGAVRDLFLHINILEVDLMVVGDGIAFAQELGTRLKVKKIIPFKKFGTAMIPRKDLPVEVTSARTETYKKDSRKPTKVIYTDLQGDLLRRDFTINAMAMDILPKSFGDLYDPLGGIADLKKKQLRTPLDPDVTFSDDPLRMIRAAYFSAKLGFQLSDECIESMKRQAKRIEIVSWERITAELKKILKTRKPSVGLSVLQDTDLLKHVFPEVSAMYGMEQVKGWHHKDVFYHTMQVVDNAAELSEKMEVRFAALVHDIAKPRTRRIDSKKGYTFHGHDSIGSHMLDKIAKRMKLSNELRDYLKNLTLLHLRPIALAKEGITDSAVRRVMVSAGENIDDLLILCRADITSKNPKLVKKYMGNFERVEKLMLDVKERDNFKEFQSPVQGKEIMKECGLSEGRIIGQIKHAIEEAILDGEIENNYEAAYEYLVQIKGQYTS